MIEFQRAAVIISFGIPVMIQFFVACSWLSYLVDWLESDPYQDDRIRDEDARWEKENKG